MHPELPAVPSFPDLSLIFQDGLYCISESDVDKLLDYGKNKVPLFKFELGLCKQQLYIVIKQL